MTSILSNKGYHVLGFECRNGFKHQAVNERPDMILLDSMLGDSDGRDICKAIKSNPITSQIPVIIVSASHGTHKAKKSNCLADAYLDKPFRLTDLVSQVKKIFRFMKQKHLIHVLCILFLILGCVTLPKGAVPVASFHIRRYLGTWYEIARRDFKYEKGLEQVTTTCAQKDKHTISVDNKGYDRSTERWKESRGKDKIVSNGRLKVSFFGPFYAGYNIIAIDPDYRYALIAGTN